MTINWYLPHSLQANDDRQLMSAAGAKSVQIRSCEE